MNTYIASHKGRYLEAYTVVTAIGERQARVVVRRKFKESTGIVLKFEDIHLMLVDTQNTNAAVIFNGDY